MATHESSTLVGDTRRTSGIDIPPELTQPQVLANPELRRFQLDLIILASFNENESLHWRPPWFQQGDFAKKVWTLQNPPNIVTERLPGHPRGREWFTRRVRNIFDSEPYYIRTLDHWARYCEMYGVPHDFLCGGHIRLLRLGLLRDDNRRLRVPPQTPLYPEPQPLDQGRFILSQETYTDLLPKKFRSVYHTTEDPSEAELVVVQSDGALKVMKKSFLLAIIPQRAHLEVDRTCGHKSQINRKNDQIKIHGKDRRWSYMPWTEAQEKSCRPLTLKLRFRPG